MVRLMPRAIWGFLSNMGVWECVKNDTRRVEVKEETLLQRHLSCPPPPPSTWGCSNQIWVKLFVEVHQGAFHFLAVTFALCPRLLHCGQESRDMEKVSSVLFAFPHLNQFLTL